MKNSILEQDAAASSGAAGDSGAAGAAGANGVDGNGVVVVGDKKGSSCCTIF